MSLSGTMGSFDGSDVVKSICFMTNQNLYGPYGTDDGMAFTCDVKGAVIVGFHGRVFNYVMPKTRAVATWSTYESKVNNEVHFLVFRSFLLVFIFCYSFIFITFSF